MTFYRGFKRKYGFDSKDSFIWLSEYEDYAKEYTDSFASVEIDESLLKFADLDTLEDACNALDYDYLDAIYNPTEDMTNYIRSFGFNAYSLEPDDWKCCCILNKSLIKNVQIGGNNEISLNLKNPEHKQSVFLQSLARTCNKVNISFIIRYNRDLIGVKVVKSQIVTSHKHEENL